PRPRSTIAIVSFMVSFSQVIVATTRTQAPSAARRPPAQRYNNRADPRSENHRTMSLFTRDECLQRLRAQVAAGRPIIGGGAGTGISAKCAEAGGIDLIIIYNSGRFRMAGRGS